MAPKRGAKAALQRGARPSPTLAMLFESPAREGLRQTSARAKESPSKSVFDDAQRDEANARIDAAQLPKSTKGKERAVEHTDEHDTLWCDLFAPRRRADVAIHKKKIENIEGWLRDALDGKSSIRKYRRVLALSGPAGSGKSTLIRTLSHKEELNFDILEWTNESIQKGTDTDFYWDRGRIGEANSSLGEEANSALPANKLGFFLASASRSSLLSMQEEDDNTATTVYQAQSSLQDSRRRIILVEDLPNISHQSTKTSFNAALAAFLHRQEDNTCPLVIIMSESIPRLDDWGAEGSGRSFRDRDDATLTLRRLVPDSIRTSVGFDHIEFNAVAPTILTKALKRVLELGRTSHLDTLPAPSSAVAKELIQAVVESAEGDLRSAVNTLQLVCLRGSNVLTPRGVKRTAGGRGVERVTVDKSAIALISGRETSLVLFHALGRILYNKRIGDPTDEAEEEDEDLPQNATEKDSLAEVVRLPPHMQSFYRRRSRVDPEALWRSMPIDAGTLQAYLHQNYTPFCESIEQCASLSDYVSTADTIKPAHEEWYHSPLIDYYSFLVTVHGCLLSLPSPVPRTTNRKLKGAALFHKMKSLRENRDRLTDMQTALKEEEAQEEGGGGNDEQISLSSLLSQASPTNLVCEIGPLLVKSHPELISSAMKDLVTLPWLSSKSPPHLDVDEEGEQESLLNDDAINTTITQQEDDKPRQAKEVSLSQTDASKGDRVKLLAEVKKGTAMEEDTLDDDEIEDFD